MITLALVVAAASSFVALPLERLQQEPPLEGRQPTQAAISPGGKWVTFLKPSATDSEVLDLWARPLPTGEPRLLVSTQALLGGKDQKLTEQERMALERKRISKRGITSYQWCGDDDTTLLFPLSGDLYTAKLSDKDPQTRRLTSDDDSPEQNPSCTKDGRVVAYVKKGAVVTHDLTSNKTKILTKGSSDTVSWGLPEFIAEEELGRHEGMWWSPDGKRLLVLKVDESGVAVKVRAQIFADKTEMVSQRYPAAGEKNAVVSAFVVDAASGKSTPVTPLPKDTEYIARGGFFADGDAWLQVLNREQTKLTLLRISPKTGKPRVVVEETDAAWVEVHDDLDEAKDGGLLWSSEASGRKQLVRLDRNGQRAPLTTQPEPVSALVCAAADHVVFSGAADRGRAQHLFVVDAKGTRPLTSGASWNDAKANKACTTLLVTSSSWGTPASVSILDVATGKRIGAVDGDAPDPLLRTANRAAPQWLDVTAADGVTVLNGLYLPPAHTVMWTAAEEAHQRAGGAWTPPPPARGPKNPVITFAYGGPTGQVVAHRWARMFPLFLHWQQQGFGVFLVDTRGMASRDRAFTRAHKNAFGKVEVDDVFAAARQLPRLVNRVDPERIGIFGWSYGGTLAARAMLDDDTPFAAGAAVAPVTDWTLYDTAYTERYIGVPVVDGKEAAPYASSSLLTRAKLLKRPLLLAHGTADDNVLFEHTLRLVQALQDEGALFQTSLYPGKAHGIAGKASQLHLHKTLTRFFVDELRPVVFVDGGLSREEIQRQVTPVMGRIKRCYEAELNKDPQLAGKVTMYWLISGTGHVTTVSVPMNTFPARSAPAVERCIVGIIKALKFPSPKGGGVVNVTYPFVFAVR